MDTGERFDIWNPTFRNLSNRHIPNWAPVSATAVTSAILDGRLSRARLRVTWGCAVILALFYSPLLKISWPKVCIEVLQDTNLGDGVGMSMVVIWPRKPSSAWENQPYHTSLLGRGLLLLQETYATCVGHLFYPSPFLEQIWKVESQLGPAAVFDWSNAVDDWAWLWTHCLNNLG